MATKKQLIIQKYIVLTAFLKQHLGNVDLFSPIDEVDLVDLLFFINMLFESEGSIREGCLSLMKAKGIVVEEAKFDQLFPVVEEFLMWLRDLK